jgi:hypothetical protein
MKHPLVSLFVVSLAASSLVVGQTPPVAAPSGQKSLAATMNVYVFPNGGQTPEQQSKDEGECYNWAAQNTGTDPFQLANQSEQVAQQTEQAKQQAAQSTRGAGARGAVGGAAAGALIGEIADDDAGEGAAYGAAAGLVVSRRRAHRASEQAQAQAEQQGQQAQAATQEQLVNFKKAFSVCLEAKQYMVKY